MNKATYTAMVEQLRTNVLQTAKELIAAHENTELHSSLKDHWVITTEGRLRRQLNSVEHYQQLLDNLS